MKRFSYILTILCLLVLSGCGGKYTSEEFMREDVDFDSIRRVAVLPFLNHTEDRYAGQRARNIATTQILALGVADVVDRGIVDSVLLEEVIDASLPIDLLNLKRLGQRLNVQAFLLGSVDISSGGAGSKGFPAVGITLRMVDSQASVVIWQASGSWDSETVGGRIVGATGADLYHVNLLLLKDMLKSLSRK